MKPSKFQFKIECFVPSSSLLEIVWKDGILLGCNEPRFFWGHPEYIILPDPTEEMWQAFYHLLKTLDVKNWDKFYNSLDIIDGQGWTFRIRFKDIHRTIEGINSYPCGYEELYKGIDVLSSGFLTNTED
jgi:hypothetical protein